MTFYWFRRDLRLKDNHALYQALSQNSGVVPVFIFDKQILGALKSADDARVTFIYDTICALKQELRDIGSDLLVLYGDPVEIWPRLAQFTPFQSLFFNRDYEPSAILRDKTVHERLQPSGISTHSYKDHVIFEKKQVAKPDNGAYTVFTPYSKRWLQRLAESAQPDGTDAFSPFPSEAHFSSFLSAQNPDFQRLLAEFPMPTLQDLGFSRSNIKFPALNIDKQLIKLYKTNREFPYLAKGTSHLGLHLRFGTLGIRELAREARPIDATFLNELIWRDFYAQILANFPHIVGNSFRPEYDRIAWRNNPQEFEAWKLGKTGYPLVDAGMRQLNATGYMHNRVRMVVASFLCKHLLIDWRWGEAYFAEKLLDFDLASNNGGWQWASGSGTDAAPYFRIFNPEAQQSKFDKDLLYIRRWIPEYGTPQYPKPIVEHTAARSRCLDTYKLALDKGDKP